jgi:short-subunit dehydrogenase
MDSLCTIVGVGPGIGLAVAERFARAGFRLALVARRQSALDGYAEQLRAAGAEVRTFAADAGDPAALGAAMAAIEGALGPSEVLVYNASAGHRGPPSGLDSAALVADFQVSVVGALVAAQAVIPAMRAAGRGSILLTGGGLALNPYPDYAALAVGKAGLRNLAASLAAELKPDGIHVATVTVAGFVQPGGPLAPELIAERYWQLHAQAPDQWEHEILLRG